MFTLLLINIIGFTTWMGFKNPGFMERMRFSAYAVKSRGELHRVISSALVHATWSEFIWLAVALFLFGRWVEDAGGAVGMYLIFAWGIIGGNLIAARLNRDDMFFSYFGMAAGVNSVIFAFVLLAPWRTIITFPIPLPLPAWVWAFLQLGLTAFGFRSCCDPARRVANLAGSAAGLLVAGMVFHEYARANLAWFAGLLAATILCIWLVQINRAGLPWGAVLRARISRDPRPRTPSKPSRKPAKPPPEDVDALLDKISASGLQSLTEEERARLRAYSEKQRR